MADDRPEDRPEAPASDVPPASPSEAGSGLVPEWAPAWPWPAWWTWAAPLIAAVVLGLPTLLYPFGRDQGNYAYAGWVLLDGGALYRDVFVFKPPMAAVVHALAMLLFGVNMVAVRLLDLGWVALTAAVVALLAHRLVGRRDVAVWAGVAFSFLYWQVDYWNIAQSDGWLNLPAAGAVLAVLLGGDALERRRTGLAWGAWVLGGVLVGIAVLFKYTAGLVVLPCALALIHVAIRHGRRALPAVPLAVVGLALPLLATWLALVVTGAWEPFLDVQLDLVPQYVEKTRKGSTLWASIRRFFDATGPRGDVAPLLWTGVAAVVPAGLSAWWSGRRGGVAVALAVVWWLVAAVGVLGQGKYFDYHYLPLLPPTALLAGLALSAILAPGVLLPRWAQWLGGALLVGGLVAIAPLRKPVLDLWWFASGSATVEEVWRSHRYYQHKDYNIEEQRQLVELLRETTTPDQRVFVWGFDPAINVWAQRRTVSRFLYNYPFRVSWGNPAYEAELLGALEARPPDVFVVASRDATYGVTGNRKDSLRLFVELGALKAFVDERYTSEQKVGRYQVYRLRP